MKQFLLTRKFVSIVNSKLSELKSILANNNLDNAKKIMEIDYLDWDGAIKKIDTESIKNEIVSETDSQNTFDAVVRLLNLIDFGDIYSQIEKFKDDAFFDLIGYDYEGEYVFDDFSKIIDICETVRTEVSEMMRIYNLKNNYPKVGFLFPSENEWLFESDVTGDSNTRDKIKLHYKNLNIPYFLQCWQLVVDLDSGTDVDMGGGEYCQTNDLKAKLRSKQLLIEMFDKLKKYERVIYMDAEYLEKNDITYDDELHFVITLRGICKTYHNEVEQIRDKLILDTQADNTESQKAHGKNATINSLKRQCKNIEKTNFRQIIQYKEKEVLIKRLHELIDGKKGADVGAVLLKAKLDGHITRCPSQKEFLSEFELNGTWQAITNYFNENSLKALAKQNTIIIFPERQKI